jgi:hypothetical protein
MSAVTLRVNGIGSSSFNWLFASAFIG